MKKSNQNRNSLLWLNFEIHKSLNAFVLGLVLCVSGSALAQTTQEKNQIRQKSNVTVLGELKTKIQQKTSLEKRNALQIAKQKGWQTKITDADGTFSELQKVVQDSDGKLYPIYYTTYNVAAAKSTRADHLNIGGSLGLDLDGQNMTAYVWDGGHARPSHREYDGLGGNNRVSIEDTDTEGGTQLNFHAGHVTGTITASGVTARAKGMAPQSKVKGYMWNDDFAEMTEAAANGMLISNHSYGYPGDQIPDQYFGAYILESSMVDEIMFNAPYYLMVVAAGNDGNQNNYNAEPLGGNSSFDKLSAYATAKNNLIIANANDASIANDGSLNSVRINSSSSEGPTDDYRIKPDLAGNGTSVYSTYTSSDSAYNSITGTSMASPNVAGTLLLLQQHHNNIYGSFMKSATLKGLALHTADDAGLSGPDAVFGWGLLNAKKAAEALSAVADGESMVQELTLNSGDTYTMTVDADGINSLMTSISWTDQPGIPVEETNSDIPVLVNDLDIRVTKGGTSYEPYRLTGVNSNGKGDNKADPFERIDVSGASGEYTITVTHKGTITGGSQDFSLIITGIKEPVVCVASQPTNVAASNVSSSEATINWRTVPAAQFDVRYRANGSSSWTTVNDVVGTTTALNGLEALTTYEVQVRSTCDDGSNSSYSNSVSFTTADFCIARVDTLPYTESFEGSFGDWAQSTSDDIDWTLNSGSTPSGSTGPNDAADGNSYIYVEASGEGDGFPNKVATLVSPCYDFSTASSLTMEFQYHMLGSAINALTAEVKAGNTGTWSTIFSKNGAQGSAWNLAIIDLSAYQGAANVQFRFTAITGSGSDGWQSDIAIDALNITEGDIDNQSPSVPTGLIANAVTQTSATLTWNPSTDNVGVTEYDVYQGSTVIATVATTTTNVTGLSADTTYSFSVTAKDAAGNVSNTSEALEVTTEEEDTNPTGCTGGIATFPYNQGFENTLGTWSQDANDDIDWTLNSGGTPSDNTGPTAAAQGSSYIYVEASGEGTGFPNKVATLNSPCFDLSDVESLTLGFKYHMRGSAINSLNVEARTNNEGNWTSIFNKTGAQGNNWNTAVIDLVAYEGLASVQLRITAVTGSGSNGWQSDIAIDDLSIKKGGSTPPPPPGGCDTVDFNNVSVSSYANQDRSSRHTITNGGNGITLTRNTWKSINFDYTITPNTVLEFEFTSTDQAEINGIGFDNNNTESSDKIFKLYGTENYGITNYDTYNGGTQTFVIPVGSFYTGTMDRMVFVSDSDGWFSNSNSQFVNIKVYEGSCGTFTATIATELANVTPSYGDNFDTDISGISVTPNPTTDNFAIQIPTTTKNVTATVYSILGSMKSQIKLNPGVTNISAKNLSLSAGIYLIKIDSPGADSYVQKLVIQ